MRLQRKLTQILLVFALLLTTAVATTSAQQVSSPGVYSGYNDPYYDNWIKTSIYVPVTDGTKLAVDIYRPTKGGFVETKPLPVIFQFTGYRRATLKVTKNPDGTQTIQTNPDGSWIINYPDTTYTKYGYVMVYADTRGKGASYGTRYTMVDRTEAWDGHDLVEWIAKQPWCNGKIGMSGSSYTGNTQAETASTVPPHLVTVIPGVTDYSKYDATYRGGMHRTTAGGGEGQDDSVTLPVDEDRTDANSNGIMDMLEEAIKYHKAPYLPDEYLYLNFIARMPYRDSFDEFGKEGFYWIDNSNATYFDEQKKAGITFYHTGGWYDLFTRDTVMGFNNLGGKLLLGPNGHFGSTPSGLSTTIEYLRWYDYWLKGIHNNVTNEPPVYYYTVNAPVGTEWRFAPQFPLAEQQNVKYYLAAGSSGSNPTSLLDGRLSTVAPTAKNAQDSFKQDYIQPVSGCSNMMGYCSYDKWSLTYTTDALSKDLQVTGSPIVHLWAASSATDQDYFADLEDIDQDGKVVKVVAAQGRLRASHRKLATPPFKFMDLPWHRSYQEDMIPLIPNTPTELVFDILPTSHVFKEGHRIRLVVMAASKHALNFLTPDSTVTVYREKGHASYVTLPTITRLNIYAGTVQLPYYSGPADLYASPTAIYIGYDGKWLKWDTERNWKAGVTEHFKGRSAQGPINVVVTSNGKAAFVAQANGKGVHFSGLPKY